MGYLRRVRGITTMFISYVSIKLSILEIQYSEFFVCGINQYRDENRNRIYNANKTIISI